VILFLIGRLWNQSRCSLRDECPNHPWLTTPWNSTQQQKELTVDTHSNLDKSHGNILSEICQSLKSSILLFNFYNISEMKKKFYILGMGTEQMEVGVVIKGLQQRYCSDGAVQYVNSGGG
jgi:hypothetical protein